MVKAAGVDFGGDELFRPPLPGVGAGPNFEHALFEEIYERLGQRLQHPWFGTRPLPDGWPALAPARTAVADLLETLQWSPMLAAEWGWKSSQAGWFLPLWDDVAVSTGADLRIIVVLRNPLAVARSLRRLFRLPESQGLRLWMGTLLSILEHARAPYFCDYEAVLADPAGEARRLLAFMGREADPETVARMVACVCPEACHIPSPPLPETETLAGAGIADLYRHCQALAAGVPAPAGRLKDLADYRRLDTLFQFGQCDVAPRLARSFLAIDLGAGFSSELAGEQLLTEAPELGFIAEFSVPPGARRLLFVPCQGLMFRCRIERVEGETGQLPVLGSSARKQVEGWDLFIPDESVLPGYQIGCNPARADRIRIAGKIELAPASPGAQEKTS
jgi:hypothetical protein